MEAGRSLAWRDVIENPQRWLVGGCIAVFALLIGSELWSSGNAALLKTIAPAATSTAPEQRGDDVERIVAADLFGHAANQAGNQNLPETNLQLVLRGVFAASDPQQASAMIETGDGHVQIVKIGANVAQDTVLQQVFGNRVVFSRNGVLETLYFPASESATDVALSQNIAPGNADTTAPDAGNNAAVTGTSSEEIKRAAILRRLEELRARSSQ